jgi:threonine/homoserine/homoserine lactone efflux protein
VTLNTTADVVVSLLAGPIGSQLRRRPRLRHGQRYASGGALIALGGYVAVSGERR